MRCHALLGNRVLGPHCDVSSLSIFQSSAQHFQSSSRHTMVRVMPPETVAWMLRQMNPIVAGRVGTRLGVQILTFILSQVHPNQALATLRQIPFLRPHEVAESLEQPLAAEGILA